MRSPAVLHATLAHLRSPAAGSGGGVPIRERL
jgi:hypothetical protein